MLSANDARNLMTKDIEKEFLSLISERIETAAEKGEGYASFDHNESQRFGLKINNYLLDLGYLLEKNENGLRIRWKRTATILDQSDWGKNSG